MATIVDAFRRVEVPRCLRADWRRPRSASLADATTLDVVDDDRSAIKPAAAAARDDAAGCRMADDDMFDGTNMMISSKWIFVPICVDDACTMLVALEQIMFLLLRVPLSL